MVLHHLIFSHLMRAYLSNIILPYVILSYLICSELTCRILSLTLYHLIYFSSSHLSLLILSNIFYFILSELLSSPLRLISSCRGASLLSFHLAFSDLLSPPHPLPVPSLLPSALSSLGGVRVRCHAKGSGTPRPLRMTSSVDSAS